MTKRDELSITLMKALDKQIRNIPYYSRLISGEEEIPKELAQQINSIDELTHFINVVGEAFNGLEEVKKPLISLYYFEGKKITLGAAAELSSFSKSGANRTKKEFLRVIAKKIGWL